MSNKICQFMIISILTIFTDDVRKKQGALSEQSERAP